MSSQAHGQREAHGRLTGAGVSAAFIVLAAVPALVVAETAFHGPSVVPAIAAATLVVVSAARVMFRPSPHLT